MEQQRPDTTKLIELIKAWKINMPILAEKSGMKMSTFRNKVYHPNPIYFFTNEEYLTILRALNLMAMDIINIYEKDPAFGDQSERP